jgi:DNA mismatch repair protein MutL
MHLYLLFETDSRLAILDMHAAHERVMFFKIKTQLMAGGVRTQGLLLPETIVLAHGAISNFDRNAETLRALGFDCERFGDDTILVRSTPALLGNVSAKTVLDDLFSLSSWSSVSGAVERVSDAVIARMACHRSVRSGRDLEPSEAYALIKELDEAEGSAFCPHGRPVVIWYSETRLEQLFGRSQF